MAKRFIPLKLKHYEQDGTEVAKTYQYRLGPKAADLFQSISGVEMSSANIGELGIKGLVYMLYAGCQSMHHDLTMEKMWEIVDNYELDELEELTSQITPEGDSDTDPNDR